MSGHVESAASASVVCAAGRKRVNGREKRLRERARAPQRGGEGGECCNVVVEHSTVEGGGELEADLES